MPSQRVFPHRKNFGETLIPVRSGKVSGVRFLKMVSSFTDKMDSEGLV